MTIDQAIQVSNVAQHRGVRLWRYDAASGRVLPAGWNGLEVAAPPAFTAFEALSIARGLAQIGALQPARARV